MKLKKQQLGHAAILFVMCIPILFGVFTLASDGARALQSKARLEDAAESAILAVSAYGEIDNKSTQVGKDYIKHYMNDIDSIVDINLKKLECSEIPECAHPENGKPFSEYRISGQTKHISWFPGDDISIGFGKSFNITGSSKARKYQGSQPMDITFVLDFSRSMTFDWAGHDPDDDDDDDDAPIPGGGENTNRKHHSSFTPPSRLESLQHVVETLTDQLQIYNDAVAGTDEPIHRIAMTGYNRRTINKDSYGKEIVRDQRIIKHKGDSDLDDKVDFDKTIKKQFFPKGKASRSPDDKASFYDINYTSDFKSFNKQLNKFKANGGTASLQGILRASQIVSYHQTSDGGEANPRQLIIIISDGEDYKDYLSQAKTLVNRGMCDNLRNAITGGEVSADDNNKDKIEFSGGESLGLPTNTGEEPSVRIAMIGIGDDYNIHNNKGLLNCVGEDNAFSANNEDDILSLIMSLVSEEVGHLAQ